MRKFFFIILFINIFILSFSKSVTFNFNTSTGRVEYFKSGDLNTQSNYFYDGTLSLDLDNKEYYFLFINEDFPVIQKVINLKDINQPINIVFTKENYIRVEGNVKSNYSNLGAVTVSFTNSQNKSYQFSTDIFGKFIAYLPPDNYSVNAERFGYTLDKKNKIIYNFSSDRKSYKLDLNLIELPCFIQGKVVDENNHVIPYPKIFIKNGENIIQGEGDEFGMFKFQVNSGIITVLAQKHSFFQNGVVRKVEKNSSITNIEITLSKVRYSITGVITDGIKALNNIELQLMNEDNSKITSVTSDENGFFEFYKTPGDKKVFIIALKNGKILKKTELIDLNKDIKDFNIILN